MVTQYVQYTDNNIEQNTGFGYAFKLNNYTYFRLN